MYLTKRELWEIREALCISIRSLETQRLNHQMFFYTSTIKTLLYLCHTSQTRFRVKMAVDSNYVGT